MGRGRSGIAGTLLLAIAVTTVACTPTAAAPHMRPSGALIAVSGSRCPPDDAGRRDVAAVSDGPGLLPPAFAVSRVLVCEYAGPFGKDGGALRREVLVTGAAARRIGAAAGSIDVVALTGPVACPADLGTVTVLALESAARGVVDLWWTTTGCQSVDDGAVSTKELGNPSFWRFQEVFRRATARG